MKNIVKLTLILAFSMWFGCVYSQESANSSGGDATGSGGTVAYSIGQVVYTHQSGINGDKNQGVQQPYEIYSIGIDETELQIELNAFPNPATELIHIEFKKFNEYNPTYQLIDEVGRVVQESQVNDTITSLDLSKYQKGTYFLKIATESKTLKTFKIIKN